MAENFKRTEELTKEDRIETAIQLGGKRIKSISELRTEQGITCTLNQFLTFGLDLTDKQKADIVKGQIPNQDKEKDNFPFWFNRALWPIKKSFAANQRTMIYNKISELENFEFDPTKKKERADVLGSIEALNKFLSMRFPEPFNHVRKKQIKLTHNHVIINGVAIKVTPDLVFETIINGETHVGSVKILLRKGNQLEPKLLKIGAYILYQYLTDLQNEFQGLVNPKLCAFLDVFHESVATAPDRTSTPQTEIRALCNEYSEIWTHLTKTNQSEHYRNKI